MSDIEMTIDAVRDIANRTMGRLQEQAQQSKQRLAGRRLPVSAFGGWPEAQALGRHHDAAQRVFLDTIEAVIADLEGFAANLRATADSTEQQDQAVEERLVALGRGYDSRPLNAEAAYTSSVEEHTGARDVALGELDDAPESRGAAPAGAGDGSAAADATAPPTASPTVDGAVDGTVDPAGDATAAPASGSATPAPSPAPTSESW